MIWECCLGLKLEERDEGLKAVQGGTDILKDTWATAHVER